MGIVRAAYAKLVGVINSGLGAAFPWLTRRLAEAEAMRIRLLGAARTDVEVERERALHDLRRELTAGSTLTDDVDYGLVAQRAAFRVQEQERKRQRNLESIAYEAVLLLPETVSDNPVDEDFIARFFGDAQDVSNPTMQRLWATILAGEVAQPGQFALRTLDVLRNLSIDEARLFEDLRRHICYVGEPKQIFLPATSATVRAAFALDECGLVLPERTFKSNGPDDEIWWGHADLAMRFVARKRAMVGLPTHLGFFPFTRAGESIMRLGDLPSRAHQDTLREIEDQWSKYFEITVSTDKGVTTSSVADHLTTLADLPDQPQ